MKINFSKKEYRLLIDMLYLGDWMINSYAVDPEEHHQEYETLRKKILSYYKEMEAEDIIEYSKKDNDYFELSDYDDYVHKKFIDIYDDNTFWDELSDRLALRDVMKKIGITQLQAMEGIERVMKLDEIKELYTNEFEEHGLERIKIKSDELVKN